MNLEGPTETLTRRTIIEKYPIFVKINYNYDVGSWWYNPEKDGIDLQKLYEVRECSSLIEFECFFKDGLYFIRDDIGSVIESKKINKEDIFVLLEGSQSHENFGNAAILKEHCAKI